MTKTKKISIVLITILLTACILIDGWFLYVKFYAPTKLIVNTYEGGLLHLADGSTKSIFEVKYLSNENLNGYECLDLKLNYLLDENADAVFSQGIQFVVNKKTDKLEFGYFLDKDAQYVSSSQGNAWNFTNKVTRYGYFGSYNIDEKIGNVINYSSANDFEDTTISTLPINDDSSFRIQLGDKLYMMKFKGTTTDIHSDSNLYASKKEGTNWLGNQVFYDYYFYNNIYALAQKIYEGIKTIPNGKQSSVVFEFGDMFDYFEYDEDEGDYLETNVKDSTKVVAEMKSYYSILINKTADGVRKASDSLFNCVNGNVNFNLTGDYSEDDYFLGRAINKVNLFDFNIVPINDTICALKLTEKYISSHIDEAGKVYLSICIDKDILKNKGIENFVFAIDSGFDKFTIFECYSIETINGEVVRVEVPV